MSAAVAGGKGRRGWLVRSYHKPVSQPGALLEQTIQQQLKQHKFCANDRVETIKGTALYTDEGLDREDITCLFDPMGDESEIESDSMEDGSNQEIKKSTGTTMVPMSQKMSKHPNLPLLGYWVVKLGFDSMDTCQANKESNVYMAPLASSFIAHNIGCRKVQDEKYESFHCSELGYPMINIYQDRNCELLINSIELSNECTIRSSTGISTWVCSLDSNIIPTLSKKHQDEADQSIDSSFSILTSVIIAIIVVQLSRCVWGQWCRRSQQAREASEQIQSTIDELTTPPRTLSVLDNIERDKILSVNHNLPGSSVDRDLTKTLDENGNSSNGDNDPTLYDDVNMMAKKSMSTNIGAVGNLEIDAPLPRSTYEDQESCVNNVKNKDLAQKIGHFFSPERIPDPHAHAIPNNSTDAGTTRLDSKTSDDSLSKLATEASGPIEPVNLRVDIPAQSNHVTSTLPSATCSPSMASTGSIPMYNIQLPVSKMQRGENLQQQMEQLRPNQSIAEVSSSGATTHSPDTSVSAMTEQQFTFMNPHYRQQQQQPQHQQYQQHAETQQRGVMQQKSTTGDEKLHRGGDTTRIPGMEIPAHEQRNITGHDSSKSSYPRGHSKNTANKDTPTRRSSDDNDRISAKNNSDDIDRRRRSSTHERGRGSHRDDRRRYSYDYRSSDEESYSSYSDDMSSYDSYSEEDRRRSGRRGFHRNSARRTTSRDGRSLRNRRGNSRKGRRGFSRESDKAYGTDRDYGDMVRARDVWNERQWIGRYIDPGYHHGPYAPSFHGEDVMMRHRATMMENGNDDSRSRYYYNYGPSRYIAGDGSPYGRFPDSSYYPSSDRSYYDSLEYSRGRGYAYDHPREYDQKKYVNSDERRREIWENEIRERSIWRKNIEQRKESHEYAREREFSEHFEQTDRYHSPYRENSYDDPDISGYELPSKGIDYRVADPGREYTAHSRQMDDPYKSPPNIKNKSQHSQSYDQGIISVSDAKRYDIGQNQHFISASPAPSPRNEHNRSRQFVSPSPVPSARNEHNRSRQFVSPSPVPSPRNEHNRSRQFVIPSPAPSPAPSPRNVPGTDYVNMPDQGEANGSRGKSRNPSFEGEGGSASANIQYSPPLPSQRSVSNDGAISVDGIGNRSSNLTHRISSQSFSASQRHKSWDSTSSSKSKKDDYKMRPPDLFISTDPTLLVTSREGAESPELNGSDSNDDGKLKIDQSAGNEEKSSVGRTLSGDSQEMPEKLWDSDSVSTRSNLSEASQNSDRYNPLFAVSGESDISQSYNPLSPLGGSNPEKFKATYSDSSSQSISENGSISADNEVTNSPMISPPPVAIASNASLPAPHTSEVPRPHNATAAPRAPTIDRNAPSSAAPPVATTKELAFSSENVGFDLDGDLLASFDDQYKSRERNVAPPPELPSRATGKKASLRNILNAQKSKVNIPTGVMIKEPRGSGNFPKHHASSTLSRKQEYDERRKAAAKKKGYLSEDSVSDLSDASSGRNAKPVTYKRNQPQPTEKSNLEKNIESIMKTLPPQVASMATETPISASAQAATHQTIIQSTSSNPVATEIVDPGLPSVTSPSFEMLLSDEHITPSVRPNSRSRSRASSVKTDASFKSVSPMRNEGSDDDGNLGTIDNDDGFEEGIGTPSNPGSEWFEPDDISVVSAAEDNV